MRFTRSVFGLGGRSIPCTSPDLPEPVYGIPLLNPPILVEIFFLWVGYCGLFIALPFIKFIGDMKLCGDISADCETPPLVLSPDKYAPCAKEEYALGG
jgi:hypothetical protein